MDVSHSEEVIENDTLDSDLRNRPQAEDPVQICEADSENIDRSNLDDGKSTNSSQVLDTTENSLNVSNGKKKRHRRGRNKAGKHHNKKWKPYNKLTWDERKELDDRESKRATLKREERFAHGHPVAPYNTTQFLMDEHSKNENVSPFVKNALYDSPQRKADGSGSVDSSDDNESPDEDYLKKDFSETYENIHAERLQMLNKNELVKEYIELETRVERYEKKMRDLAQLKFDEIDCARLAHNVREKTPEVKYEPNLIKLLQEEIKRLKSENESLKQENNRLKS